VPTIELVAQWLRLPLGRLVIDIWAKRDSDPADEQALATTLFDALASLPATIAEVAVQPPWHQRPKPPPVELRAGADGRYRRHE
jgi:hypothetical protein